MTSLDRLQYYLKAIEYLAPNEQAPHGVRVMTGSRGGRYYESTELHRSNTSSTPQHHATQTGKIRTSKHAWERANTRTGYNLIYEGIQRLSQAKNLPQKDWWCRVGNRGYVVGIGDVIKTCLAPTMHPKSISIC